MSFNHFDCNYQAQSKHAPLTASFTGAQFLSENSFQLKKRATLLNCATSAPTVTPHTENQVGDTYLLQNYEPRIYIYVSPHLNTQKFNKNLFQSIP